MSTQASPKELFNIPINSLNFSVRASNCFRRAGILTIKDLINKSEIELLGYRNFGSRTLLETKKILSKMSFSLGINPYIKPPLENESFYKKLAIPLSDFNLSVRSSNCLNKMKINTIADLITRTEEGLLSHKNFGKRSLFEIKEILASLGFYLGMKFDHARFQRYTSEIAVNAKANDSVKQSLSQCLCYIKNNLLKEDDIRKHLKNSKMFKIIDNRIMTDKKTTLRNLSIKLSLTRERVRQLEKNAIESIYKALDINSKIFITRMTKEIKNNGGVRILEGYEDIIESQEFRIFNLFLSRIDKNIYFDSFANAWFTHKKRRLYEKIKKLLDKECEPGHLYEKKELTDLAQKYSNILKLPKDSFVAVERIIIAQWFKPFYGRYAFKTVSGVEVLSELIKEYFRDGIAIYKDISSIISLAQSKGYGELTRKKTRALIGYILRSKDLVLWDWGVYIHKANIKMDDTVLDKIDQWLFQKFQSGLTRASLWGAFLQYQKECKEGGIHNEHALYSCMKIKYGNKYSFLKDPHVYVINIKEQVGICKSLEDYINKSNSIVTIDEIMGNFGLKEYQITQQIIKSKKILQCEGSKFTHISNIETSSDDLRAIYSWIKREVKINKHISVKHAYEENIVLSKKCNILDARTLYSLASINLSKALLFPRYPYIVAKDNVMVSDSQFSFNDIANDFFLNNNRVVYYKEMYEFFVRQRGYRESMLGNICYLCDNIIEYSKDAYVALETLNWDGVKFTLLENIANMKFQDCCRAGQPFTSIDELIEEDLPKINELADIVWQKKLLVELLERIEKIKILGNMDSVYVVVPNECGIETTDDLIQFILKKEFNGATNKEHFMKRLQALRIAKNIQDNGKKYEIINEEIVAR